MSGGSQPAQAQGTVAIGDLIVFQPDQTIQSSLRTISGLPKYVRVVAWLDADRVLALAGANPIVFNPANGEYLALNQNAWWVAVSPDRKLMGYRTETGFTIVRLDRENWGQQVATLRTSPQQAGTAPEIGQVWWSPDSSRLLISEPGTEFPAGFWLFDLTSAAYRELDTHLEGYFPPDPVGWLSNDAIAFTQAAMQSEQDDKAYRESGYRRDVTVLTLTDGTYRKATSVKDGVFMYGRQVLGSAVLTSRETKETGKVEWGLVNPATGEFSALPAGAPYSASPDGRYLLLLTPADPQWEEGNHHYQAVLLDVATGATTPLGGLRFGDRLDTVWSPDGKGLTMSADVYVPNAPQTYVTWTLTLP